MKQALLPAADAPPAEANGYYAAHAGLLACSFRRLTGRDLAAMPSLAAGAQEDARVATTENIGRLLFEAPFALLSHGAGSDPCFTYGNRTALALFELTWAELLAMPSRLSAEPVEQAERDRLLARVRDCGLIDDYSGVRIARSGRRFLIRNAVVWTLAGDEGNACGQAAAFPDWQLLPEPSGAVPTGGGTD